MGNKTTHELTFLSIEHNIDDNTQTLVSTLNNPFCRKLILLKNNDNYKSICNMLQCGCVYRFETYGNIFSVDRYIENIYEQLTYTTSIKVTNIFNYKMSFMYNDFNFNTIKYEAFSKFKIFYDNIDDKIMDHLLRQQKIQLLIPNENANNIIIGKYYIIKFKKRAMGDFHCIYEYEKI